MNTKSKAAAASALPLGILASDCKYPDYNPLKATPADYARIRIVHTITLYDTTAFGWCVATLDISHSRRAATARTYAARASDGATVRVGAGPHVKRTVTVYVRQERLAALAKLVELYQTGAEKANAVRDRISSRRAQGAEMRAQGRSSWRWNV